MDIGQIVERQRSYFGTGKTLSISFRKRQLKKIGGWMEENEERILEALRKDLNKAPFEGYATELGMVKEELRFILRHLDGWSRDKWVPAPLAQFPSVGLCHAEPYGAVLIMSPWNYPFQLTLAPLLGAICAGNCALVKPSAYSPATSSLLKEMAETLFDEKYIAVIEGGRRENQALLREHFDYIFFTGSVSVGRQVMAAASEYLTPVSLELGGKSPCIVDHTANIKMAAKRIVWGKYLNAGQTCVAPDYVLVHQSVKEALIEEMKKWIVRFYGENPCDNPDYPRIVNQRHFDRLAGLLEEGKLCFGGERKREAGKIAPALLTEVGWDSRIMAEEIFGPLLPVLEFDSLREAAGMIRKRPKPLALYFFSRNRKNQKYITTRLSYGGGCINDVVVHLATSRMPFGGVGESGMGGYHGKASFDTFSHKKSLLKKSDLLDIPLRYPPYRGHLELLKKIF